MKDNKRNGILINGILISLGLVFVIDNIFFHWIFKWHRILPDHILSNYLEVSIFILGLVLLGIGINREINGRRTN